MSGYQPSANSPSLSPFSPLCAVLLILFCQSERTPLAGRKFLEIQVEAQHVIPQSDAGNYSSCVLWLNVTQLPVRRHAKIGKVTHSTWLAVSLAAALRFPFACHGPSSTIPSTRLLLLRLGSDSCLQHQPHPRSPAASVKVHGLFSLAFFLS